MRRPLLENLETRQLLASDWTNSCNALDVNNDGKVTAQDALLPINHLNRMGPGELAPARPTGSPYLDSDGNGSLSALDALLVINQLGRSAKQWSPTFDVSLANDSGGEGDQNRDRVTNDARISVHASSPIGFESIRAQVDGGEAFAADHSCGSFVFDPALASDGSDDGQHTVRITSTNPFGEEEATELTFLLDTRGPAIVAGLAPESDTGLPGDGATSTRTISISGSTEPNQVVEMPGEGRTTIADENGAFHFEGVSLDLNTNAIEIQAIDEAGNTTRVTRSIVGTPCDFGDDHVIGLLQEDALPVVGDPIPKLNLGHSALPLTSTSEGLVQYSSALLNQDYVTDIVTVSRASDEVLVFYGDTAGNLESETRYPSGGSQPTTLLVGDFIGDAQPDVVIGHLDGSIGFLEGQGDNGFLPRQDLTVTGLGTIVDLTSADFDDDGDQDLAISSADRVVVLENETDQFSQNSLNNGGFDLGLRGWNQTILGESPSSSAGLIQSSNGQVQLVENDSFLVSIHQTFTIPSHPQTISFELLDLSLGGSNGSIPDAFEVSLLDEQQQSLVATIDSDATSAFNASSDDSFRVGNGVSIEGSTVTLDISQVAPGTQATLFFDLVGSEANHNSVATIGNIHVTSSASNLQSFSASVLPFLFNQTLGLGHCDANQDGWTDLVIENSTFTGATYTVLNGDGSGSFVQTAALVPSASGESVDQVIEVGHVVVGSLSTLGQVDRYTFSADSGQTLFFDVQDVTGLQSWTLVDPIGNVVFQEGLTDQDAVEIALSGEYTLTVSAFFGGNGPYQFQIHDVPETTSERISIGELVESELSVPGQERSLQFDILSGETLFFDVQSDRPDIEWSLINPEGNPVFQGPFVDQGPRLVDQTGTYVLNLDGVGNATGSFAFQIHSVTPSEPQTLLLDQEVSGDIDVPGKSDVYLFEGTSGQSVYFHAQQGNLFDLNLRIFDPDGIAFFEDDFIHQDPIVLSKTGTYQLDVSAANDSTGEYRFVLWDIPTSSEIPIEFDQPVPGAITTPGQTQVFVIPGEVGDEITFDEIFPAGSQILYSLESPSGGSLFTNVDRDQGPLVLTESGDHRLIVHGVDAGVGSFSFQIARGSTPPVVPAAANLVVTEVSLPASITETPQAVPVAWTIRNDGSFPIAAGTNLTHHIHLSADSRLDPRAVDPLVHVHASVLVDELGPGETATFSESVLLPAITDGELQVLVHADAENIVFENQSELVDNVRGDSLIVDSTVRQRLGDAIITTDIADGSEYPMGTQLVLSGNASTPTGAVNAVFMLDLSGSTRHITGLDANFDGVVDDLDDMNSDGRVGDLLDKEIGLVLETVSRLVESGVDLRIAIGAWSGSGLFPRGSEDLDLGDDRFNQLFVDPGDLEQLGDLEQSVRSAVHRVQGLASNSGVTLFREFILGPGNNYDEALMQVMEMLDAAPEADENQVYFFSDGLFFPSEDLPAEPDTIEALGEHGIRFRAAQVVGPQHVSQFCLSASPPDWCTGVDPGIDFVSEIKKIRDGISMVPGSTADIVIADTAEDLDDVVLPAVQLAGVTINGVQAEGFDASGNFFATLDIDAGENIVSIEAIDSTGKSTERNISLVGVEQNGSTTNYRDVSAFAGALFEGTSFNRENQVLLTQVSAINRGRDDLRGPLRLVIDQINPPAITLVTPHQLDDQGRPVIDLPVDNSLSALTSGQSSLPIKLQFANATSQRFEIDYSILAIGNSAPEFSSTPRVTAVLGQDYQAETSAVDADGDSLTYRLGQAPDGMNIDPATGALTWIPALEQIGNHSIELIVEDGWGGLAVQTFLLRVHETLPNRPPLIQSPPATQVDPGEDYEYLIEAVDSDGDLVGYSLLEHPAGMTIDATTGRVEWQQASAGNHDVVIEVSDGESVATQSFTLTVGDVAFNDASPLILSTPSTIGSVGRLYLYAPFAQDSDSDSLSYSLMSHPLGMTIQSESGRIEWQPTVDQIGANTIVLRVDDGHGGLATQMFTVDVQPDGVNLPPSFASLPVTLGTTEESYEYAPTVIDPDGDSLTYTLIQGPSGMSVDRQTGLVVFHPTDDQIGTHRVELRTSDGNESGVQTFDLEIRQGPNSAPSFSSTPGLLATVGQTYFYAADATDPDDRVSYALLVSPDGMTIDPQSGLVELTANASQIGTHDVTVSAVDARGGTAEQTFTLNIVADNVAPVVSITLSKTVVTAGEETTIHVTAIDNVSVDTISLQIDGLDVPLDDAQRATFTSTGPGIREITATAVDDNGNAGFASERLRTIDPNDQTAPKITITSPVPGQQINYLTDVIGSVEASDLEFYRVDYARADLIDTDQLADDNPSWTTIGESTTAGSEITLATFDPTVLADDSYLLRVVAQDFSGNTNVQAIPLNVAAPAKLGQFQMDFTDLSIRLAGMPIEVQRSYNTWNASEVGDFGYGWNLGLRNADLRETVPVNEEQVGLFGAAPFVFGTRVYLTNPDGERVGFTFEPERTASLFGDAYTPKFTPDPGVIDRLEVDDVTLSQQEDGSFVAFLIGFPYNPDQYRLTRPDGSIYEYDQFSGLQRVSDVNGNQLVFSEDGISHSSGVSIGFQRDRLGRITQITDPDGNAIKYEYNTFGDLISVIDQVGEQTQYNYFADPAHFLSEVIDPRGNTAQRTEYDDDGRVLAVIDAAGNRTEQTWDPSNFFGSVTDANGNVTELIYDVRGNVLQATDPLGAVTVFEYSDPENPDLETKIIDRRGFVTQREYDDQGNLLKRSELGHQNNPFADPITTTFTYDDVGRVTSETDARGHTTNLIYGATGLTELQDADGNSSHYTHDDRGRVLTVTDSNGNLTTYEYEEPGRPTKVTYADGTFQRFQYNAFGEVTLEESFEADGTLVQRQRVIHDAAGRIVKTINGGGDELGAPNLETRIFYDGDLADYHVFVSPLSFDSNGQLLENPETPFDQRHSRIVDIELDASGLLIKQIDPAGGVTTFSYDGNGNRILQQDPIGNITTWVYDALDRVIEMRDPFYNEGLTVEQAIAALEQPSGADCGTHTGAGHVVVSCYDEEGNLTNRIDRNGRRTEFEYDHAGRPTEERWYVSSGELIREASFRYDVVGNLLTATDPDSSFAYTYDALNRVVTEEHELNGAGSATQLVLTHQYDTEGNRVRTVDNFGVTVESEFDPLNRLRTRKWFGSDMDEARVDFAHNVVDQLTEVRRYADLEANEMVSRTLHSYDLAGRETDILHLDALDQVLADYEYEYNEFAELVQETHHGETKDYRYDLGGQLIEAIQSGVVSEDFQYDANGNRIGPAIENGTNNQVLSDGDYEYRYDGEGNLVTKEDLTNGEVTRFEYDHRNRLVHTEVRDAEGNLVSETDYRYDVFGRRVARTVNGETVNTFYHQEDAWADLDENGVVVERYLYGTQMDELLARLSAEETVVWHLADRLGSVRDVIDSTGSIIGHADYSVFGVPQNSIDLATMGRFLYTGREWLDDLELYHYRARVYDPGLGQFMSQDPLGFDAGDSNLYRYVSNSPTNATDPTGETQALEYVAIVFIGATIGFNLSTLGSVFIAVEATLLYLLYRQNEAVKAQNKLILKQQKILQTACSYPGVNCGP